MAFNDRSVTLCAFKEGNNPMKDFPWGRPVRLALILLFFSGLKLSAAINFKSSYTKNRR
jgi:hypothetical protein